MICSSCDTLLNNTTEIQQKTATILISPNPASRYIYINSKYLIGTFAELRIFNSAGQCVYQQRVDVYQGGYATKGVDVSEFATGAYIVSLQTSIEILYGKFVKE